MKNIFFVLFLAISFLACNSPEQNSTVGNSEDSNTIKGNDTLSTSGAGVDNSGGTPGPGISTDTANVKADSLANKSKKNRALKK